MKCRVILWGYTKKGAANSLMAMSVGSHTSYKKVCGETVEYAVVNNEQEIDAFLTTKKQIILCIEQNRQLPLHIENIENIESIKNIEKRKQWNVLYIPGMQTLQIEQILEIALLSVTYPGDTLLTKGLGGFKHGLEEGTAFGAMLMDILRHFKPLSKANTYRLLLGVPREQTLDGLCLVEDVLKEYTKEESLLYIEQVVRTGQTEGCCYVLHIDKMDSELG